MKPRKGKSCAWDCKKVQYLIHSSYRKLFLHLQTSPCILCHLCHVRYLVHYRIEAFVKGGYGVWLRALGCLYWTFCRKSMWICLL